MCPYFQNMHVMIKSLPSKAIIKMNLCTLELDVIPDALDVGSPVSGSALDVLDSVDRPGFSSTTFQSLCSQF